MNQGKVGPAPRYLPTCVIMENSYYQKSNNVNFPFAFPQKEQPTIVQSGRQSPFLGSFHTKH